MRRISTGALTSIKLRRTPKPVTAFWWDGNPNFGDELTPWLLPRFGILPVLRQAHTAKFLGVGSILEMAPLESEAIVWGSGLMHGQPRTMPNATFLAVRGPLTRDLLGLPSSTPLGDPGLLLSNYIPRPMSSGKVALVVHGSHDLSKNAAHALLERNQGEAIHVRTDQPIGRVVSQIASAAIVVSSSLHGLIVADSYGIPAVWATPEDADHHVPDLKFSDYHETVLTRAKRRHIRLSSSTSLSELRQAAVRADPNRVAEISRELHQVLEQARDRIM